MKKFKLTSRDFLFFLFGFMVMLAVVIAYDWEDVKRGFTGTKLEATTIEKSE